MISLTAADAILVIHTGYVAVVVLSVPLIIIGGLKHWRWVHNFWFRATHVLMIGIVTIESILGITCPLTLWEKSLRAPDQIDDYQKSGFVSTWLEHMLFWHFPHWLFTVIYLSFTALVISLLFFIPVYRLTIDRSPSE